MTEGFLTARLAATRTTNAMFEQIRPFRMEIQGLMDQEPTEVREVARYAAHLARTRVLQGQGLTPGLAQEAAQEVQ